MPQEPEQAIAAPTPAVTVPATPSGAPAGITPVNTERVEPVLTDGKVDASYLTNLTPAQQKEISKAIRAAIPRDARGKALAAPETDPAILATESEPEPVVPEPAPVIEPTPEPEPIPEPTAIVPTPDPELEPEPVPTDGKPPQRRLRLEDDPVGDAAAAMVQSAQRNGKKLLFEDALKAAKALYEKDAPQALPTTSKTLEAANTELAALREQRKAAKIAFDEDAAETAQTAIEDKMEEIREIKEDARARQQAEVHQRQSQWQAKESEAMTLYPDVIPDKVKGLSDTGKRLIAAKDRLFDEHKNSNDPIRFRTDYPLLLLKLAAAEEGIAPSTVKKAVPAAVKVASTRSVTPAKPAPPLASASARTTPNGTGAQPVASLLGKMTLREAKEVNKHLPALLKR